MWEGVCGHGMRGCECVRGEGKREGGRVWKGGRNGGRKEGREIDV